MSHFRPRVTIARPTNSVDLVDPAPAAVGALRSSLASPLASSESGMLLTSSTRRICTDTVEAFWVCSASMTIADTGS